ncbi:aminotransferase class V-fold PLP-dependent enzyme [Priestia megaterium]|nr:aminotransferase class V-fold PLP-dependent enzyme [Priestia megaterium]
MIYLDYAATTPMSKEAIDAYIHASTNYFGNTSSLHNIGTDADELLTLCRQTFASLLNGEEEGIYFTSGGTESNYLAIQSLLKGQKNRGNHIITTKLEHASILNTFAQLEDEGYVVSYLPVNEKGLVSLEELKRTLQKDTVLVAIQHINHELGTIQPIEQIGKLLHDQHVLFHCDCVQSFGKVNIDVKSAYIDSLSVSSHKVHGPKGVGMIYMNPSVHWQPIYKSATHERGFRPGTVNVPGIAAFTVASETAYKSLSNAHEHYKKLKEYLAAKLQLFQPFIQVVADSSHHFPGIIGLTFANVQGQYVMLQCNRYGIAVSTGSACHVSQQHPSESLLAIGQTAEQAKNFIRISFSPDTTTTDLDHLVNVFHSLHTEFFTAEIKEW